MNRFSRLTTMLNTIRDEQGLADQHIANRSAELHDFFTSADNPNSDPSYLAEYERALMITPGEWLANLIAKRNQQAARYARSPF